MVSAEKSPTLQIEAEDVATYIHLNSKRNDKNFDGFVYDVSSSPSENF